LAPLRAAELARERSIRVEFVDEDDRRGGVLRLLEQVADPGGTDAHDCLHELGARDREERGVRLPADCPRQQRRPGAGWPGQEHASRDAPAKACVAIGAAQEVHDLVELGLDLVDPGTSAM
jgi:hypothetical protein